MSLTTEDLNRLKVPGALTRDELNRVYWDSFDALQKILIEEICRLKQFTLTAPEVTDEPPKRYA